MYRSNLITHQPVEELSHDLRVEMGPRIGRQKLDLSPHYCRCGGSRETAWILDFTPRWGPRELDFTPRWGPRELDLIPRWGPRELVWVQGEVRGNKFESAVFSQDRGIGLTRGASPR